MWVIIFLLGLAIGSFANVLIDRLPKGQHVLTGRSRCDWCGKTLRWYELIPVVSWLIQGGRCRRCHQPLSAQYLLVELVSGVGFVLLFQTWAYSFISLFAYGIIFLSLLVIFVADLKYQLIPDSMVLLGFVGASIQFFFTTHYPLAITNYLFSALGAAGFFYLLYRITGRRGMGLGDVKLAFLLGLLAPFPRIVLVVYVAFLTGAVVGVILIVSGKKSLKGRIAFGPFLIIGFFMASLWGDRLVTWFLNWL